MKRKASLGIMLALLLMGMLSLALDIHLVGAEAGTVYIRADGSVDPLTAPIQRVGDLYTLTGNITSDANGIVIERNDMTLDGAGYIVQGTGAAGSGIVLYGSSNVTVQNTEIKAFTYGIDLDDASSNIIYRNTLTNNNYCIMLWVSDNNNIDGNLITDSECGFAFLYSSSNIVSNNIIENNTYGVALLQCFNNVIYHNDFINNSIQTYIYQTWNVWDAGYPSGGNYWSDYTGVDANGDGIGDTPYVIDADNADCCPLMNPHNIALKAAQLARTAIGLNYGHGKGWNWKWVEGLQLSWTDGHFLDRKEIWNGYWYCYRLKKNDIYEFGYGLDCSGLVYWSYNKAYGATKYSPYDATSYVPEWHLIDDCWKPFIRFLNPVAFEGAHAQWSYNVEEITEKDLKPGDLLFFDWYNKRDKKTGKLLQDGRIDHVVMFVGDYYYSGRIQDKSYKGIYNCVNAKGSSWGIIPDTIGNLKDPSGGFVGFRRVNPHVFKPLSDLSQSGVEFKTSSPVSLSVTDPEGYVVDNNVREITNMVYLDFDIDRDGKPDDMVIASEGKSGDYVISVIPKPDANPLDTYTLETTTENTTVILAQSIPICEIPSQPYIVTLNETTIIPRLDPHDIGITRFSISKTVVWHEYPPQLNVTTFNYGQFTETFNVTVCANTTVIATFTNITLTSRNSTTITFTWDTANFAKGNYTLSAHATPVSGETYITDNTYTDDTISLKITGDVNGDEKVEVSDLFALGTAYGSDSSIPNWNPDCDFNRDDKINESDLSDLSKNYGKTT